MVNYIAYMLYGIIAFTIVVSIMAVVYTIRNRDHRHYGSHSA
jgi:hypothetical protein